MSRIKTFCPYCGSIVPAGQRCRCRPRPKRAPTEGDRTRTVREPWRREYSSARYQAARQLVIERARGRCEDCGKVCAWHDGSKWRTAGMGGEVDHEKALCEGGGSAPENMTLRCKSCHAKRDAKRRRMQD